MGGYAQEVVVSERMVLRIPDALELDVAAPLLCAGITTYSPLRRWGAGTGRSVAVVGVGGLGHMGVKIAAAMGASVTTISRSDAKAADAVALGARAHIATSDPDAMRAAKGTFDIVLNTVSADIPIADYVRLLKPNGVVVNVGLPPSPYSISPGSLIGGNKAVAGSSIGGSPRPRRCSTSAPSTASPRRSRSCRRPTSTRSGTVWSTVTFATGPSSTRAPSPRPDAPSSVCTTSG